MNHGVESAPVWEIFCRVVDNFGDIGVSLRLARELRARTEAPVRLWVDDWAALCQLCPELPVEAPAGSIAVDGLVLQQWTETFTPGSPGTVVIEAFACDLPAAQLAAMLDCTPAPCWINLEYLSAETWVGSCHGLGSPHPRLPLHKYFFFPGFDADSGGLLREADLLARRDAFQRDQRDGWLRQQGVARSEDELCISLFAYRQPGIGALLQQWVEGAHKVHLLIPQGQVLGDVLAALEMPTLNAGEQCQLGQLGIHVLPFVAQTEFDALLWACDVNFVRGEDSFVRALWAAVPLVWQLYPQQDEAHFDKLAAFLEGYLAGLSAPGAAALERMWKAWNGRGEIGPAWENFALFLPELRQHARGWAARQAQQPDLATQLIRFCSQIDGRAG